MAPSKKPRTVHDAAFKREVARLITEENRPAAQVAREYGVPLSNVRRWEKAYQADGDQAFSGQGNLPADQAELQALKRELSQIKEERDILKKRCVSSPAQIDEIRIYSSPSIWPPAGSALRCVGRFGQWLLRLASARPDHHSRDGFIYESLLIARG